MTKTKVKAKRYSADEALREADRRKGLRYDPDAAQVTEAEEAEAEAEAGEPKRYTTAEALAVAAERRDKRMGRKASETRKGAAKRAAAVIDAAEDEPDDRYKSMQFAELQQEAKGREINAGGSADQIKGRLREADVAADQTPAPVAPPADESTTPATQE